MSLTPSYFNAMQQTPTTSMRPREHRKPAALNRFDEAWTSKLLQEGYRKGRLHVPVDNSCKLETSQATFSDFSAVGRSILCLEGLVADKSSESSCNRSEGTLVTGHESVKTSIDTLMPNQRKPLGPCNMRVHRSVPCPRV